MAAGSRRCAGRSLALAGVMTDPELRPCPFCEAGKTDISGNTYWMGGRKYVDMSFELTHTCLNPGPWQSVIRMKAKTREELTNRWNTRS